MPFYRYGKPGEDRWAHLNFGRRGGPAACASPRLPLDDPKIGAICGRQSVALCDAKGCDLPMCELHRTRHATKPNTDFCPNHRDHANAG